METKNERGKMIFAIGSLIFISIIAAFCAGEIFGDSRGYSRGYEAGNYAGRQIMINQYESRRQWLTTDNYNGLWN